MKRIIACIVILTVVTVLSGCAGEPPGGELGMNEGLDVNENPSTIDESVIEDESLTYEEPDSINKEKVEGSEEPDMCDEAVDSGDVDTYDELRTGDETGMNYESKSSREIDFFTLIPGGETALDWIMEERATNIDMVAIPDKDTAVDVAYAHLVPYGQTNPIKNTNIKQPVYPNH